VGLTWAHAYMIGLSLIIAGGSLKMLWDARRGDW
jgi:hypothetical protein